MLATSIPDVVAVVGDETTIAHATIRLVSLLGRQPAFSSR